MARAAGAGSLGAMNPFRFRAVRPWLGSLLLVCATAGLAACGGGDAGQGAKSPEAEVKLDDALALLPGSAIALATIDGRAFFGSETFGADLAKLLEPYVPLGEEAGFQASRDVDRVTLASYSYQGVDVAAIVVGRFDEAKIKQMVASNTPTKSGVPLVASKYADHDVYTANNVGFTLLSGTRAIAGTESGIRRVLERIADKRVKRDLPSWMIETIETPGAAAAVAGDFATTPAPAEVLRQVPLSFVQSLRMLRLVAAFKKPGIQLAGSLSYPDEAAAESASKGISQALGLSNLLAVFGIKIQDTSVKTEKTDVQVQLSVDDASLRQIIASAPQWLGR